MPTHRLAKVPLYGNAAKAVTVNLDATAGAQIGTNLLMPDGTLATAAKLQKLFGAGTQSSSNLTTTDDLQEGQWNLYFTPRRAQDAVGGILLDSANVTLRYVAGTSIIADLTDASNTATGTLQAITVDAKGRVTGYRDATITGTAGRITVAHGGASDGLPTIDLAEVADAGGGTLQRTVFDTYGRKTGTSAATTSDLAEGGNLYYTDARADERITIQKAQPNGLATLDGSGKLDSGQLPALAITSTFVVADETSMLALDCQQGDVAVRTDLSKSFILTADPPSALANWQELLVPTAGVTSFNGRTGSVTPASGDYTFAQIAGTPTTLTGYGITDAATSAQGAKADSAVQPGDLGTAATHAATDFDAAGDAAAAQTAAQAYADSLVAALPQGVPYLVADGQTFRVAAGMQALWSIPIDLEGDAYLDIEGALVEVA